MPDHELILIAGASAIVDRRDVIPAAIERTGGRVEHYGMPVDPGNLLLARFSDMGWVYTNINHQSLKDTERMDGEPYKLTATILSDNGYISNQVKLHYTTDGVNYTTVNMASTGNADEYAYSLPGRTSACV